MAPPHLHPRSRMTSSLFATTVFISFFVVALPHALPCPAPRVAYADGEQPAYQKRRRRRRPMLETTDEPAHMDVGGKAVPEATGIVQFGSYPEDAEEKYEMQRRRARQRERGRTECPVPKPGGFLGKWMGFYRKQNTGADHPSKRPQSSETEKD